MFNSDFQETHFLWEALSILLIYWIERSMLHSFISPYDRLSMISSFFLITPWVSMTYLIIHDCKRQRCKTMIIQHSPYLNYDINHHLIFATLTSLKQQNGASIIILTPVYPCPGSCQARVNFSRTLRLFHTTSHYFAGVGANSMVWSGTARGPT